MADRRGDSRRGYLNKHHTFTFTLTLTSKAMEEGTKAKKTVFVGGIGDDIDESAIYESFSTFGKSKKL